MRMKLNEIKKMLKGEDVFFTTERLKEMMELVDNELLMKETEVDNKITSSLSESRSPSAP